MEQGISIPELIVFNFIDKISSLENIKAKLKLAKGFDQQFPYLLEPEHIAYCMSWKDKLNPSSNAFSLFYPGIGADLITPLLSTNATEITGVNNTYLNPSLFQQAINLKDSLTDSTREVHEWRKESGFWHYRAVEIMGLEFLICSELKMLGLSASDIKWELKDNHLEINFNWAYPGEEPKPRKINIHFCQNFTGSFKTIKDIDKEYNCYFIKSPGADGNEIVAGYLVQKAFLDNLKTGGCTMLSPPDSNNSTKNNFFCGLVLPTLVELSSGNLIKTNRALERLVSESKLTKLPHHCPQYGWQLFGVQKY